MRWRSKECGTRSEEYEEIEWRSYGGETPEVKDLKDSFPGSAREKEEVNIRNRLLSGAFQQTNARTPCTFGYEKSASVPNGQIRNCC